MRPAISKRIRGLAASATLFASSCNAVLGISPPELAPADAAVSDGAAGRWLDSAAPAEDGTATREGDAASDLLDTDGGLADAAPNGHADATTATIITGIMTRVSVTSDGTQANNETDKVSVSGDGDLVAFSSSADNLVINDSNDMSDVFIYRRSTGETTRLSIAYNNAEPNGACSDPVVTTDGKNIVFTSLATNLSMQASSMGLEVFSRSLLDFNVTPRSRFTQDWAFDPAASADGFVVAYDTTADSGESGADTNQVSDVYANFGPRSLIKRISIGANGVQGNGASTGAAISGDGQLLAFQSEASNLVANDTNGASDIFIRGLSDLNISRVSVSSTGGEANGPSDTVVMSSDGKHIAFCSRATNLVPGDTNGVDDVFVHDLTTHQTLRASVSSRGAEGNEASCFPSLSGDGRLVAFSSTASNLVDDDVAFPGDTNYEDIFVHDMVTGITVRVSTSPTGTRANGDSTRPKISSNGRVVVFTSGAPNLVPGDTNGYGDAFAFELTSAPWF